MKDGQLDNHGIHDTSSHPNKFIYKQSKTRHPLIHTDGTSAVKLITRWPFFYFISVGYDIGFSQHPCEFTKDYAI